MQRINPYKHLTKFSDSHLAATQFLIYMGLAAGQYQRQIGQKVWTPGVQEIDGTLPLVVEMDELITKRGIELLLIRLEGAPANTKLHPKSPERLSQYLVDEGFVKSTPEIQRMGLGIHAMNIFFGNRLEGYIYLQGNYAEQLYCKRKPKVTGPAQVHIMTPPRFKS